MKYFSGHQVEEALRVLERYNPFFGITFLVLKRAGVPIGSRVRLNLDAQNRRFLEEHYRLHPKSQYFFRVFRPNNKAKDWVEPNYASTGLQAINTQTFRDAILHEKNDNTWGWASDYIDHLAGRLPRGSIRIPLFHLAVWLYRNSPFEDNVSRDYVVNLFIREFALSENELSSLFQVDIVSELSERQSFQDLPAGWYDLLASRSTPKDAPEEISGTLRYLEANSVGPVRPLVFQPSERLNLITGDNGLGKTFLLDLSWWALTGGWSTRPASPSMPAGSRRPQIKFAVGSRESRAIRATFEPATGDWDIGPQGRVLSGLAVYAMLDGSFAVWDPAGRSQNQAAGPAQQPDNIFSREQVWDGKLHELEGLIRDWVRWQQRPDLYSAYHTFKAVLERLVPHDLGPIHFGEPVRIHGDSREIPTLVHPYGIVPILFESGGIRRVLSLAYLLVWAWEEHKNKAKQLRQPEERQMIVLIDEVEAHLHPKWQRAILPALLGVSDDLHGELAVQWLIASHSPLVMASGESIWNTESDSLFHIDMNVAGEVSFEPIPFERRGTIDSWLSSGVFDVPIPGSIEREAAIQAAIALQQEEAPAAEAVKAVDARLSVLLPPEDPFWVRWIFFAQAHGSST